MDYSKTVNVAARDIKKAKASVPHERSKMLELYVKYARLRYRNPLLERGNFISMYGNVFHRLAILAQRFKLKELTLKMIKKEESYHKQSGEWFDEQWAEIKKLTGKSKDQIDSGCPSLYLAKFKETQNG